MNGYHVDLYALLNNPKLKSVDQFLALIFVWADRNGKDIVKDIHAFFSQVLQVGELASIDTSNITSDYTSDGYVATASNKLSDTFDSDTGKDSDLLDSLRPLVLGCVALKSTWASVRQERQKGLRTLKEIRDNLTPAATASLSLDDENTNFSVEW